MNEILEQIRKADDEFALQTMEALLTRFEPNTSIADSLLDAVLVLDDKLHNCAEAA